MVEQNSHIGNDDKKQAEQASYRVLARKYRPSSLSELIGQEAMVKTLENAFESKRIHQAYMLTGVRGVGKTSTARILARALNYEAMDDEKSNDKSDHGRADIGPSIKIDKLGKHCKAIMNSSHVDVIEMDAASHTGIDDVREIIDAVQYKPVSARYKVYIIDEVHMLSRQAFNGLLKTLEEPPEHVKFIFATTEIRKVPITILSRCQRFDLRRVSVDDLVKHYQNILKLEEVEAEDEAVLMIAKAADGSVRDGLSILDQSIAFSDGKIKASDVSSMLGQAEHGLIIDIFEALIAGDARQALLILNKMYNFGADITLIFNELCAFTHYITKVKLLDGQKDTGLIPIVSLEVEERANSLSQRLDIRKLGRLWQMLLKASDEIKLASSSLAAAEMAVIRISHIADLPPPDEIIKAFKNSTEPKAGNDQTEIDAKKKIAESELISPSKSSGHAKTEIPQIHSSEKAPPNSQIAPPAINDTPDYPSEPDYDISPEIENESSSVENNGNNITIPSNFDELIEACTLDREIELKRWLYKNVRLVLFEPGKIEINLEGNSDPKLPGKLRSYLNSKSEVVWKVVISDKAGDETYENKQKQLLNERKAKIEKEAEIVEFIKIFPEAELIDIEEKNNEEN